MFGFGRKLTESERKAAIKKGEKIASGIIKFMTPDKNSRPKPGYKHGGH